jgi:hypothetical protein
MPSAAAIAFSAPSEAGTPTNASAGEAGELAALGPVTGDGPDAKDAGTPFDDGAALPSPGDDEVAQAEKIAETATRTADRRIVGGLVVPMASDLVAVIRGLDTGALEKWSD